MIKTNNLLTDLSMKFKDEAIVKLETPKYIYEKTAFNETVQTHEGIITRNIGGQKNEKDI